MILLVAFLANFTFADVTPLPALTQEATNKNFRDLTEEIRRIDESLSTTTYVTVGGSSAFTGANTHAGSETMLEGSTLTLNGYVIGTINKSTTTTIPNATALYSTTFGPCLTGSTITFTVNTSTIVLSYSGAVIQDAAGSEAITVLQDGSLFDGATNSIGWVGATDAGHLGNLSFSRIVHGISIGSHSYCIALLGNDTWLRTRGISRFTVSEWK